jgi:hypothetical protein
MEKYKQTTLCIYISKKKQLSQIILITKDNKPLEFETEQGARKWASANIEAKKSMIVSWSIIRAEER